jgi:hypothetical protein
MVGVTPFYLIGGVQQVVKVVVVVKHLRTTMTKMRGNIAA